MTTVMALLNLPSNSPGAKGFRAAPLPMTGVDMATAVPSQEACSGMWSPAEFCVGSGNAMRGSRIIPRCWGKWP